MCETTPTYTCTYVLKHTCVKLTVSTYSYVCTLVCMYVRTIACVVKLHMHLYVCTCTLVYMHTSVHIIDTVNFTYITIHVYIGVVPHMHVH